MANFQNISIIAENQRQYDLEGSFYGLTFFQSDWGNIDLPTEVTDVNDFVSKFGEYRADNKNDWFQIYNFLQYSRNLKIFRLAWLESFPNFDAGTHDLLTAYGSTHSHLFLNSKFYSDRFSVWNSVNNGSTLYFKANDLSPVQNTPTFLPTHQHIFVSGKYAGERGNDIGITIANINTDLENSYVFKHTELFVNDKSLFTIGDVVIGDTSLASGVVVQIHSNQDIIYVDKCSISSFTIGETVNVGLDSITDMNSADDVDTNYKLSEVFKRSINIHEIGIVVTLDDQIMESGIYSLSYTDDNYILVNEFQWINVIINSDWIDPRTLTVAADQNKNIIAEITNDKLRLGFSTFLPEPSGVDQLDLLKDEYFADFSVLFTDTYVYDLIEKLKEINNTRNDFILIFNRTQEMVDINYLVDIFDNYVFTGVDFVITDIYESEHWIPLQDENGNYILDGFGNIQYVYV